MALIGSGIGPSLTPALHEREAAALGLTYSYARLDLDVLGVPAQAVGDLVAAARAEGLDGLNITHPCKQLVLRHLDELSPEAAALGAVNTVVFDDVGRAVGHNTDWSGFTRSFERGLPTVPRERVVLLGAGGAGAALAHALLVGGTRELTVLDVEPTRARTLASVVAARFPAARAVAGSLENLAAEFSGTDGVVHATPTGMAAHPGTPFDVALLPSAAWVVDVVYRPLETELLRAARAAGHLVLDGGGMAVFQAVDSFRLFTGREPDAERMLAHFQTLARVA
ncbi:MAG: shikimate dehydrogenase [Janthinobacterium lividum]